VREIWSGRSWARVTRPEWTKAEIAARSDFWPESEELAGPGFDGGQAQMEGGMPGGMGGNAMGGMMMHPGMLHPGMGQMEAGQGMGGFGPHAALAFQQAQAQAQAQVNAKP